MEGTTEGAGREHQRNTEDSVKFRKGRTNFTYHQCEGVRLSEEAKKTGSPNSKHTYGERKVKLSRVPTSISLFIVGKKPNFFRESRFTGNFPRFISLDTRTSQDDPTIFSLSNSAKWFNFASNYSG